MHGLKLSLSIFKRLTAAGIYLKEIYPNVSLFWSLQISIFVTGYVIHSARAEGAIVENNK